MAIRRTATSLQSAAALLFSIFLAIAMLPMHAFADDVPTVQPEISGRSGGCTWVIDATGRLTIEPIAGTNGTLDVPNSANSDSWAPHSASITSVVFKPGVKAGTSMDKMFHGMNKITSIDFGGMDTIHVTSMNDVFSGCTSLATITGMNFNIALVTSMEGMFGDCRSLKTLDLSSFKSTSNVTSMSSMFAGCESLTYLDLSTFDTSNVTTMPAMFANCRSLQTLILTNFSTSKAETMESMFANCTSLKTVQIGKAFSFIGAPGSKKGCALPIGAWLSTNDNTIFTASQIAETRNNIADIYVKNGTPASNDPGSSNGSGSNGSNNSGGTVATHQIIYRVYNPNSGEHFYTANVAERDHLIKVGWRSEGIGWRAPSHGANVYRVYNPNVGDHFYTTSEAERDHLVKVGWNYEGVSWKSDLNKTVCLYRVYNPNEYAFNHHWTTSKAEFDHLVKVGWKSEGLGWYAVGK